MPHTSCCSDNGLKLNFCTHWRNRWYTGQVDCCCKAMFSVCDKSSSLQVQLCKENTNLFHSRGHSSFLQGRSAEPLCILSLCLCVAVLQTHAVDHIRLVDVGEDVNHLQTAVLQVLQGCHTYCINDFVTMVR